MNKKILLGSLIAATLCSGNVMAKNPHPTDTDPVTGLCSLFDEGDVFLSWVDLLDEGEKYGGDLEIDFSVDYLCLDASEGTLDLSVEIDLDQDEESILSYSCDGSLCTASAVAEGDMGWVSAVQAAIDAAAAAACGGVEFVDTVGDPELDSISFSVKEMNPGPGKSQDKVKAKVEVAPEPDSECPEV